MGADEEGSHGDDVPPLKQGDDTLHVTLVGGGLRIVDGSLLLLQVPVSYTHLTLPTICSF